MVRPALILVFLLAPAAPAQTVEKEFVYEGNLSPLNASPTFDNGHLIIYEREAKISIRPPMGAPAITVTASEAIAGAGLTNGAADTDGFIAAAVTMGSIWGIALFRPDGRQERFIETTPLMPAAVRFGPDHTLWATVFRPNPTQTPEPDYSMLRHYNRDGRLLSAALPRSTFDAKTAPISNSLNFVTLHVAGGRIGLMLDHGLPGRTQQWLEMDLSGKVTGRWDSPRQRIFGVTANGSVYGFDGAGTSFFVFDRTAGKWNSVSIPPSGKPVGVDGDQLVFLNRSGLAQWISPPK